MGIKVSLLDSAGALDGTETVPVVKGGVTKRTTATALAALGGGGGGGGGGSSLPTAVSFSAAVPLDGNKVMAAQTVSSVIAFTPGSSPVLGAQTYVRITANGTNAPTFAGFTEHGSSAGYLNTNGVVNLVRFWYDGATAFFAVSQALNAVPFVAQSAAIANATPTQVQLTFDRALNSRIVPAASAFAVTNSGGTDTVSAVSISGSVVTLTKSRTTLSTDTVSVAYTAPGSNPITDANGNVAGSSTISVTNNVGASGGGNFLRFPTLNNGMVETADGGGYDYASPADDAGYGSSRSASTTLRLSSGQDGGVYIRLGSGVDTASAGPILALFTTTTPTDFGSTGRVAGVYAATGAGGVYQMLGASTTGSGVAFAGGDLVGLFRTETTITARVSKDAGSTWTDLATWTGVTTAALTAFIQTSGNDVKRTIYQPKKTGTWA